MSHPVYNSELKIEQISHEACAVDDAQQVILLTSKVQRKSITVRITDTQPVPDNQQFVPRHGWALDAQRRPTNIIANDSIATHHQFAISFAMPQFWDVGVNTPRAVNIVSRFVDHWHHGAGPLDLHVDAVVQLRCMRERTWLRM